MVRRGTSRGQLSGGGGAGRARWSRRPGQGSFERAVQVAAGCRAVEITPRVRGKRVKIQSNIRIEAGAQVLLFDFGVGALRTGHGTRPSPPGRRRVQRWRQCSHSSTLPSPRTQGWQRRAEALGRVSRLGSRAERSASGLTWLTRPLYCSHSRVQLVPYAISEQMMA